MTTRCRAGPLSEMAFWQSRHEALGVAYEQLDTSDARAVIALLKSRSSDRNLLASFYSQHSELVRVRPCMHASWERRQHSSMRSRVEPSSMLCPVPGAC